MKRIEVANQIVDCDRCELHEICTLPVPFRGEPGSVAIVGEAPGEQEDAQGKPFVGPAGQLLGELLTKAGITVPVAYVNTVSCYPHGTPTWDHVRSCETNKWTQLEHLNPTYILLLGKIALKGMRPDLDLRHGRARPFLVRDRVCFCTYHPAAALRNGKYEATMVAELQLFRELLTAPDWRTTIPDTCTACPIEAEWWEPSGLGWCPVHLPHDQQAAYDGRQSLLAAERDAARRRDTALIEVEGNADPDWMATAWDALVNYLRTHPQFFVDDWWAETTIERPRESRAFGPIVLRAARQGLMRKTGKFRKSTASNMTEKPVWESLVFQPPSE